MGECVISVDNCTCFNEGYVPNTIDYNIIKQVK